MVSGCFDEEHEEEEEGDNRSNQWIVPVGRAWWV
jgi:hypothetical protein